MSLAMDAHIEHFGPVTETVWPLDELISRCAGAAFTSPQRADPYWDGIFSTGTSDSWVSASLYRQMPEGVRRYSGVPKPFVMSHREALEELASNRNRAAILTTLGAVDSWRTLTREQLAAIAGSEPLAQHFPDSLAAPFSAGLLANGYVSAGANRFAPRSERMSMWAVGENYKAFTDYSRSLTFAERIAITGGGKWSNEHRFDRHNALATELALRAAEYCDIATVIGEKHCGLAPLLASTGTPVEDRDLNRKSDLAIVRPDGLVILVEVTASFSRDVADKMQRWAELLQRHPIYELPVAMLILDVSTPQQQLIQGDNRARTMVRDAVAEAVRAFPGSATNRVAERMGVASWSRWFPGRHLADESFLSMTADFATGSNPMNRWESASILDPHDLPASHISPTLAETITKNQRIMAGIPHWLRTGERPDLAAWMLHSLFEQGMYDLPTREEVLVPERMAGPPFLQSVGGRRQGALMR